MERTIKVMAKTELKRITKHALEKNVIIGKDEHVYVSKIGNKNYSWEYRRYEGYFNALCDKSRANNIRVYDNATLIKIIWF